MTLLILLFAHLLADYPLQGDFLARFKGDRMLLMFTHCGIWCGCVFTAAHLCGIKFDAYFIGAMFTIHFFADIFKARGGYGKADPLGWPLWVDQGIHFGQLILIGLLQK